MVFGNTVANALGVIYVNTLPQVSGVLQWLRQCPHVVLLDRWFDLSAAAFGITIFILYELPIRRVMAMLRRGQDPPEALMDKARRRMLNQPYFAVGMNLFMWLLAAFLFGAALKIDGAPAWVARFVVTRAVLTGLITSVAAFFLLEHIVQHRLAPILFPHGGIFAVRGALRVRIGVRLVALVFAAAVLPLVGLLMMLAGSQWVLDQGLGSPAVVFESMAGFLRVLGVYSLVTALILTLLVALNLIRPLRNINAVVQRVRRGDFSGRVQVMSNDEIGYTGEAINLMTEGLAEREMIKETFGKYVARQVRDEILAGRVTLDGEFKEVTLLFSDLRDFTPMVEAMEPKQVVSVINRYFGQMTRAISENQGLVLQYVGDAIEAVFGAPLPQEGHQRNAASAALAMRARLEELNRQLASEGVAPLRHGVGIHTGQVLAANIGSPERLSYALVGDTVNLASRISDLTKRFNADVLVSASTAAALDDSFDLKPLPPAEVKGKSGPVTVFALGGPGPGK